MCPDLVESEIQFWSKTHKFQELDKHLNMSCGYEVDMSLRCNSETFHGAHKYFTVYNAHL